MIITASEYFPVPHLMQVLDAEAPTVVEYVPTPQAVQTLASLAPVVAEYLPAPQVMQAEAPTSGKFGKYLPASQLIQAEAPTFKYLPAPHLGASAPWVLRRTKLIHRAKSAIAAGGWRLDLGDAAVEGPDDCRCHCDFWTTLSNLSLRCFSCAVARGRAPVQQCCAMVTLCG